MSSFNLNLTIEVEKIEQPENININYNEYILNCKYFNRESQISLKKYPVISDKFFFNMNSIKSDIKLLINFKHSVSLENFGTIDFFVPFFFIKKKSKKFFSQKFELKIDNLNKEKLINNNNNNNNIDFNNFFINFYFNIFLDYKNVYSFVSNFSTYNNLKKKPFENVFTKNNFFIYMQNYNENISDYFNEIINYSKYSKNNSEINNSSTKNKKDFNKKNQKNTNENKNEISANFLSKTISNSIEINNNNNNYLTLQNETIKDNNKKHKTKNNKNNNNNKKNNKSIDLDNNNNNTLILNNFSNKNNSPNKSNSNNKNKNNSNNKNLNKKIFSPLKQKTKKTNGKQHISDSHLEIYHDINFLNNKNIKNYYSRKHSLIQLIPENKSNFFSIKKQKSLILKTLNTIKLEENIKYNKSHNNSLSNKSNKSKKNSVNKNISCNLNFDVSTNEKIINEEIYKNNTLFIKINKNINNINSKNSIQDLKQNIINNIKLFLNNHKLMSIKLLKQKKIEISNKKNLISNSQKFYEISKKNNKFQQLKNNINYSDFITNTINHFQNKIALKILESSSKELNFSKDLFKIHFTQTDKERFDTIQKTNKLSEQGKIRLLLVSIRKCIENFGNISQILNEDAQIRLKAVFYKYNIKENDENIKNYDEDEHAKNRFKLKEIDKINAIQEVNEDEESDYNDKYSLEDVIKIFCSKNIIKYSKINDEIFVIKGIKVKCFFNENKKITFQFDNNNFNIEEFKNYLDTYSIKINRILHRRNFSNHFSKKKILLNPNFNRENNNNEEEEEENEEDEIIYNDDDDDNNNKNNINNIKNKNNYNKRITIKRKHKYKSSNTLETFEFL